jgi:hypothetical protein
MPVFFIVGGFTNAASWRSARERGVGYADWLRARAARLLRPALVFVAFWTVLPVLAVAIGLPSGVARTGGREVALPIWFLAVYLLTVAAALANTMVMTFYLWNMTAAVLAAVILLPTGIAPQPEPLSTAWWWLRFGWIAACAICLVPFLLAFRWAERPGAPAPTARAGWVGVAMALCGAVIASAGMAIIAAAAFLVQGEVVAMPALGSRSSRPAPCSCTSTR